MDNSIAKRLTPGISITEYDTAPVQTINVEAAVGVVKDSIKALLDKPVIATADEMFSWFGDFDYSLNREKLSALGISPEFLESDSYGPLSLDSVSEYLDMCANSEMSPALADALDEASRETETLRGQNRNFAVMDEFAYWPTQVSKAVESFAKAEDDLHLNMARAMFSSQDGITWRVLSIKEAGETRDGGMTFDVTFTPTQPLGLIELSYVVTPYSVVCDETNNPPEPEPMRTRPSVKEQFLALKYGRKP